MNLLDLMVKIGVDDQASSRIGGIASGITGKLGSAAQAVGKVMAGVGAAAGAGAIAIGKAAVESYASYEQLAGGVDKLYQGASDKVKQYAQNAYRTAGMSANQYMEQATSFSASLINSLGGDTEKAAEQTDKAMRLMSDNVNTFGSNMGDVQNAIQGLSRENYTMLDNLKLGYAGTKEGMQQLIDDANEYAKQQGINADLTMGNFSDMIDAIDLIQQKQHIWGTTAKEAMTTIEGSVNATKAAWENFLTAIGAGDQDMIGQSVRGIIDGIFGTFNEEVGKREGGIIANVLPIVQNVGKALVDAIPGIAESMVWNLIEVINDTFGTDFDAEEIMTTLENAFGKVSTAVTNFVSALTGSTDLSGFQTMFDTVMTVAEQVFTFLTEHATEIGTVIGTVITVMGQVAEVATNLFNIISPYLPFIATLIGTFGVLMPIINGVVGVVGAISGAVTFLTTVVLPAIGMIQSVGGAVTALVTILGGPITIIAAIAAAIIAFVATNEDARKTLLKAWDNVVQAFQNLKDGASQKIGDLIGYVKKLPSNIKSAIGNLASAMQQKGRDIIDGIKNGVVNRWDNLRAWLAGIPSRVLSSIGSVAGTLAQKGRDIISGLKSGLTGAWGSVSGWVSGIPTRIKNALGGVGSLLSSAGRSIINGLKSGMESAFKHVKDWVSGVAGTIRRLKGPLDYDKTVLIDNGEALMYGLQKGLSTSFEGKVKPYVKSMAGEMSDAFNVPSVSVGGTARSKYGPSLTVTIGSMTVRNRDDAEYMAQRISDIWSREIGGTL